MVQLEIRIMQNQHTTVQVWGIHANLGHLNKKEENQFAYSSHRKLTLEESLYLSSFQKAEITELPLGRGKKQMQSAKLKLLNAKKQPTFFSPNIEFNKIPNS